ncbi:hypothetical protein C5167_015213 [Papaver somniferum]|uniref:Uncharacterized protein n=1 Tax=Papaver somniferum TaxID=3469 RepID=A0A4Y7J5D9_PAPSO|nr:hypothetical protein C5167_015213 [Papaver somniferum]
MHHSGFRPTRVAAITKFTRLISKLFSSLLYL